ncbi:hypothetical protein MASR2M79_16990 [Aminivibrio sp.]
MFSNPFASLNPRMIIRDIIGRVLEIHIVPKSQIAGRLKPFFKKGPPGTGEPVPRIF